VTAIVDAGVLYALVDRADPSHARAVAALESESEAIIVPLVVLPEVCYLIGSRIGSGEETAFIRYLADSDWRVEALVDADLDRVVTLLAEHGSAGLGFVPAAMIATAERMGAVRIYTFNRSHFGRVRPVHVDHFEIRPNGD
jgi:predicted nucleic acid-binding protein